MSPIDEDRPEGDEHRFDLLADGELGEGDRRELLSRLDEEPGGWRRCALAFLEAQSWKEEFGAMAGEPARGPAALRATRRLPWGRYLGTLLAMAASFAAALVLGSLLEGFWGPAVPAGGPRADALAVTGVGQTPPAEAGPEENGQSEAGQPPETVSPNVWLVELPGQKGPEGEPQVIRLPAIERDRIDQRWLDRSSVAIPLELAEELERFGVRIHRRRELLPYPMEDGRQLVVPVEEVDLHYVGNPAL